MTGRARPAPARVTSRPRPPARPATRPRRGSRPRQVDHANVLGSCSTCHNGLAAKGQPANHIPTTAECDNCHATSAWIPAKFDHTGIASNCASCHDGIRAGGKPATHIRSSTTCESCHVVAAWKPASLVDHAQVLGTCFSCHDGTTASGKNATHIPVRYGLRPVPHHGPVAAGQFLAHRPDRSVLDLP